MPTTPRKPRAKQKQKGKWLFVPDEPLTPEQQRTEDEETVWNIIGSPLAVNDDFPARCAAVEQFHDYFPDENEVPEQGAWVLVKTSPNTPYTVTPLSIWFAQPWPMESPSGRPVPKRVKILTPRGELGLFPREYSIVHNPAKYFEFVGNGMSIHFFSGDSTGGVPELPLFYLRSRGISKADAIALLIGQIKTPGVCWMETDKNVAQTFVHDKDWPSDDRLATKRDPQ
jgi:hypothetical protein